MTMEQELADLLHEARCGPENAEHLPWTQDHGEWDLATAKALILLGVQPTVGKWVTDVSPAEYAELLTTIERLRRQNHEFAERKDREMRELRSTVDRFRYRMEQAKERVRGAPVDWTTARSTITENSWWEYTSQNNRDVVMAVVHHYEDLKDANQ